MQFTSGMQRDELEFEDNGGRPPPKKSDPTAMRILKDWVAKHDGEETNGSVVDREFVVVAPRETPK